MEHLEDPLEKYYLTESDRRWFENKDRLLLEEESDTEKLLRQILSNKVNIRQLREIFPEADKKDLEYMVELINSNTRYSTKKRKLTKFIEDTFDEYFEEYYANDDIHSDIACSAFFSSDDANPTIICDDYLGEIGIMSVMEWKRAADEIFDERYNKDRSQDKSTYIDWFDPEHYDSTEDAIEAAIHMAQKAQKKNLSFGPTFPEPRTYIPLKPKDVDVKDDIIPDQDIVKKINDAGYEIENYKTGIAKQKNGTRKIKIGKLLKDSPRLKKKFDERMKGQKIKQNKLSMVFTYNPRDIATMSTGRGWTSCADLGEGGVAAEQIPNKIKFGGMVVYLINQRDKEIKHPIARIAIRRFIDKDNGSFILLPEKICYGAAVEGFEEQVRQVLEDNNKTTTKTKMAIVKDAEGGYSDTGYSPHATLLTHQGKLFKKYKPKERKQILLNIDPKYFKDMSDEKVQKILITINKENIRSPKEIVETIIHLDREKTLSKYHLDFLLSVNLKSLLDFEESEEKDQALERFIDHLFKVRPKKMKTLFTTTQYEKIFTSAGASKKFIDLIEKHVDKIKLTPSIADQLIFTEMKNTVSNLNLINSRVLDKKLQEIKNIYNDPDLDKTSIDIPIFGNDWWPKEIDSKGLNNLSTIIKELKSFDSFDLKQDFLTSTAEIILEKLNYEGKKELMYNKKYSSLKRLIQSKLNLARNIYEQQRFENFIDSNKDGFKKASDAKNFFTILYTIKLYYQSKKRNAKQDVMNQLETLEQKIQVKKKSKLKSFFDILRKYLKSDETLPANGDIKELWKKMQQRRTQNESDDFTNNLKKFSVLLEGF